MQELGCRADSSTEMASSRYPYALYEFRANRPAAYTEAAPGDRLREAAPSETELLSTNAATTAADAASDAAAMAVTTTTRTASTAAAAEAAVTDSTSTTAPATVEPDAASPANVQADGAGADAMPQAQPGDPPAAAMTTAPTDAPSQRQTGDTVELRNVEQDASEARQSPRNLAFNRNLAGGNATAAAPYAASTPRRRKSLRSLKSGSVSDFLRSEATSNDDFSLSLAATNMDVTEESAVRAMLVERLSRGAIYSGNGYVADAHVDVPESAPAAVDLSSVLEDKRWLEAFLSDPKKTAMRTTTLKVYFCLMRSDFGTEYVVCLAERCESGIRDTADAGDSAASAANATPPKRLTGRQRGSRVDGEPSAAVEVFKTELDDWCQQLAEVLDGTPESHAKARARLDGWWVACVEYVERCVQAFDEEALARLIHLGLSGRRVMIMHNPILYMEPGASPAVCMLYAGDTERFLRAITVAGVLAGPVEELERCRDSISPRAVADGDGVPPVGTERRLSRTDACGDTPLAGASAGQQASGMQTVPQSDSGDVELQLELGTETGGLSWRHSWRLANDASRKWAQALKQALSMSRSVPPGKQKEPAPPTTPSTLTTARDRAVLLRRLMETHRNRLLRAISMLAHYLMQAQVEHYALYYALELLRASGASDVLLRNVRISAESAEPYEVLRDYIAASPASD